MSDIIAEAVARKLTKKQREALLGIPKIGEPYPGWPKVSRNLLSRLHDAGLIWFLYDWREDEENWPSRSQCYLTPPGVRVRAVLLAETARHD